MIPSEQQILDKLLQVFPLEQATAIAQLIEPTFSQARQRIEELNISLIRHKNRIQELEALRLDDNERDQNVRRKYYALELEYAALEAELTQAKEYINQLKSSPKGEGFSPIPRNGH